VRPRGPGNEDDWHLIGHNEGCCSNTGYILLPCFHGIRLWIWPEPLVAPRVRRALGTRMDEARHEKAQPRPQGLPRGGARAEEDPGKIR
jgi:hypothetical protein